MLKYNQKHQKEYLVSIAEIVILIIGIILVVAGYSYGKIAGTKKQKTKTPAGYTEYIGICKKHIEKDGKFHELFEIVKDGKTLKYEYLPQDSKGKLRKIDSIEKFYISNSNAKTIKNSDDIAKEKAPMDKKRLHICYAVMGVGLICIFVALIRSLFWSR